MTSLFSTYCINDQPFSHQGEVTNDLTNLMNFEEREPANRTFHLRSKQINTKLNVKWNQKALEHTDTSANLDVVFTDSTAKRPAKKSTTTTKSNQEQQRPCVLRTTTKALRFESTPVLSMSPRSVHSGKVYLNLNE